MAAGYRAKQRFHLDQVVLGDRGTITEARVTADIKAAGPDRIAALRAPAIMTLLNSGALRLTPHAPRATGHAREGWPGRGRPARPPPPPRPRRGRHGQHHLLRFPGERLVVCRDPDLAAERTRKREEFLAETEKDFARIKAAVGCNPLRGKAEIALNVGAALNTCTMKMHFDRKITDTAFSFARKTAAIAGGHAPAKGRDRRHLRRAHPRRRPATRTPGAATNPWAWWSGGFVA
jgi:hypothetical protein